MENNYPEIETYLLTVETLAVALCRTPATIRTQLNRSPKNLPPRARIPGSRRVLWFKSDVEKWLAAYRQLKTESAARDSAIKASRRGPGRPPKMLQGGV